jgi:hypothetical protein
MKQTRWIFALVAVILWAGCGGDDSTSNGEPVKPVTIDGALVVPAAWAGTWEITLTMKDCVTDAILSQEIITSQICPGDTLTNPFAPLFEDCQGTQTGNHLEANCSAQSTNGACQVDIAFDFSMDVNGNQLTGSGTLQTTTTPDCDGFFTAGCTSVDISGTRTSSSTAGCTTRNATQKFFVR